MANEEHLGGMFGNVALLDVASLHPSSIEAMQLFGPYTQRYSDIKKARILIKHKQFDEAKSMINGAFADILKDPNQNPKALAQALKIAINSVYGLTSARFPTRFNDVESGASNRNLDNKVAKRGALFMIKLKHEVQNRGYTVVHVKTDSVKIADADQNIIDFTMDLGHQYGYNFELESIYDRMVIVNKSTYIAHSAYGDHCGEWTATGLQFQIPYVFKTLFSKEPIEFKDLCETKSATSSLYLDFNEDLPEGEHAYSFVGKVSAFSPVKPGYGGGILVRDAGMAYKVKPEYVNTRHESIDGSYPIGEYLTGNESWFDPKYVIEPKVTKFSAATGTKGYRWKESSILRDQGLQDQVDRSYYDNLVEEAIETINHYGSYDWLIDLDQPYISPNPKSNELLKSLS